MERILVTSRFLAGVVALSFVLAACGKDRSSSPQARTGSPSPDAEAPSPSPSPATEVGSSVYEVWFHAEERLTATYVERAATPRIGTAALEDLLAGPLDGDLDTSIPEDTDLLGLSIEDGIATVDTSSGFGAPGGSLAERMRLAQVVFTLTQFETVRGVVFEIDGKRIEVFGSHGFGVEKPLSRSDFEDLGPAIVVDLPSPGATISSPIMISGNANVFEATVSIRILDSTGAVIEETFTTATCGTGCRGDYEAQALFAVDEAQDGTVMLFESSAESGRPINVVKVPVTLAP
jgi:germination protein M